VLLHADTKRADVIGRIKQLKPGEWLSRTNDSCTTNRSFTDVILIPFGVVAPPYQWPITVTRNLTIPSIVTSLSKQTGRPVIGTNGVNSELWKQWQGNECGSQSAVVDARGEIIRVIHACKQQIKFVKVGFAGDDSNETGSSSKWHKLKKALNNTEPHSS
jgi:hypothetical protein